MLFSLWALQNTCRECPRPGPLYLCGRHGSDEGLWSLRTTWTLVRALAPVLRERHTSALLYEPSARRVTDSSAALHVSYPSARSSFPRKQVSEALSSSEMPRFI